MSGGKPRQSTDPLYLLLRAGNSEEFNRRIKAGRDRHVRTSRHPNAPEIIGLRRIETTSARNVPNIGRVDY